MSNALLVALVILAALVVAWVARRVRAERPDLW